MADKTNIEWCDSTFNPWIGCAKVSPGCDHCYAEKSTPSRALGVNWGPGMPRRRTSAANWRKPLQWNANAAKFFECPGCGWRGTDDEPSSRLQVCMKCATRLEPARQRVFCAGLADVFDNAVDREWRDDLATLILSAPNLDWLLLTKRIGNAGGMLGEMFLGGPPENIWLGATITSQAEADRDIPKLLAVPAAKRFLSMEPLLGEVDIDKAMYGPADSERRGISCFGFTDGFGYEAGLDWVIVGGESGPHARPMHPEWARSLRDQCADAGVPFMFKQWGKWAPPEVLIEDSPEALRLICNTNPALFHFFEDGQQMGSVGKKAAGRLLDGIEHGGVPS